MDLSLPPSEKKNTVGNRMSSHTKLELQSNSVDVSIVVPLYNEEGVVAELYSRLTEVMKATKRTYEIVFVDDGSKDKTFHIARTLVENDKALKLVKLRSNFGQTAGIAAGIDHASGQIIITMDGDLQHLPEEIPLFLQKIDEGFDIASGWRVKRVENFVLRRFPSLIANRLMRWLSGIDLHDFGTTFKAYRRSVIENVRLYGQFHRFVPVLCRSVMKVNIAEVPIKNVHRKAGKSNYGIMRTFTVFFDLIRLKFILNFLNKPLQIFGVVGLFTGAAGVAVLSYILFQRIFFDVTLASLGSGIFILGLSLVLAGLQFVLMGLLGELIVKLYFDGFKARCYVVENVNGDLSSPIHPALPVGR